MTLPGACVDLHAHSTASDGSLPPAQVITHAQQIGLSAIALTDHDTVEGIPEAISVGGELGIRVVPGCELSAHDGDEEIHLLVLHIADLTTIRPRLVIFREHRAERAREMVKRLNDRRIAITFDDVLRVANGAAIGRPHVARALIDAGHVANLREAFDRYLAFGKPAYVPKPRLAIGDAIAIAHSAGALAVWAHPGRDGTRDRVQQLVPLGLDGVEVLHPSHTPTDVARLTQLVGEFGLVPSGGSDWHGAMEGYRTLGNMHVPATWLALQDDRLAARAA